MLKIIFTFILLAVVFFSRTVSLRAFGSELHSSGHTRECGRVIPGAERMASGIDLSTFNPFTILSPTTNPNFLQPVLKFTCDQNKTYVNPFNHIIYDVPDQISTVTLLGGGQLYYKTFMEQFTFELKAQMAAHIETDSFFGLFADSEDFSASYSLYISQGLATGQISSQISSYEILFHIAEANPELFNFTNDAAYVINDVAKNYPIFNETSFPKYENVFTMFGTHHFKKGGFGGLLRMGWLNSKLYVSQTATGFIAQQAEASFFNFITKSGGFSGGIRTVDSVFLSNSRFTEKCLGGNGGCPNSPAAWTDWANSVSGNPWLFSGAIEPNYLLIDNPFFRLNMQAATWNHFYRAFLMKEVPLALSIVKAQLPLLVHQEGQCVSKWISKIKPCKSFVDPAPAFNNLASTLTLKIQSLGTEIDQLLGKCAAIIAKSPIVDVQSVLAIGTELVDILKRVESLSVVTACHFHVLEFVDPFAIGLKCAPCSSVHASFCDENAPENNPAFIRYPRNL